MLHSHSSRRPCYPSRTTLSIAIAALFSVPTYAQQNSSTQTGDAKPIETVIVVGQRAALKKAIAAQEQADNIVSVVSADDIGALPDKNAAEALARLPGVSVQRDQGEGRYVTVRGLGADLNSVTINGALVPSPENGRRGVALDVLPTGLIRTLEVSKTLRPDMDANSIGGAVEVKTLSAFDLPGSLLAGGVSGGYDENTKKQSPAGNLLWAKRFHNGTLGLAIGASAEKRQFGSDNVETGGAWDGERLSGFELRDYLPKRERNAIGFNLDYRPTQSESYYLHTFFSQFSDDEVRDRLTISNIAGGAVIEGQTATARAERRLRQRKYTQAITSLNAGLNRSWSDWRLQAELGLGKATEDTPESINDARFRGLSNFAQVGFVNTQAPRLVGPDTLFNPASYSLNGITLQARMSEDDERHAKFDLARKLDLYGASTELKFGAKTSRREKTNDTEQWGYTSSSATSPNYFGGGATSLTAFAGPAVDYTFGSFGPSIDANAIRARVAGLNRDAARLIGASTLNDFRMNEDIDAAYLQMSATFARWNLLAGVRNERTSFDASGFQVSGNNITSRVASKSYSNWLPGVHARIDVDKQTSVRAAMSSSVVRANFSQLAPGISLASSTEATIGNPELRPLKSTNFDVGIEHLLGQDGAASAYLFSKNIKDFTYTTNLAGTGSWANYTSAQSFANGEKARVHGIELAYTHSLRSLPAPWNGLIVGVNATFTDSKAKLSRFDRTARTVLSRDIPLPNQSDTVFNVMVGYENGTISTRLALNQKSPYLLEVGGDILNAAQDRIVDSQRQLDFSFAYRATKQLQIVFEALNLNNEKYYVYQGSNRYNAQYEEYGRTYKLGLRFDLF